MFACRLLGHRFRFRAQGDLMTWSCQRGCGMTGSKRYASAEMASRYASVLDHEDASDLGKRAPFIALLPLRIWRWRRQHRASSGLR
ncbi:MAG: hypothetical protein ACRDVP_03440 [Acidimicrobiales bacterium]